MNSVNLKSVNNFQVWVLVCKVGPLFLPKLAMAPLHCDEQNKPLRKRMHLHLQNGRKVVVAINLVVVVAINLVVDVVGRIRCGIQRTSSLILVRRESKSGTGSDKGDDAKCPKATSKQATRVEVS